MVLKFLYHQPDVHLSTLCCRVEKLPSVSDSILKNHGKVSHLSLFFIDFSARGWFDGICLQVEEFNKISFHVSLCCINFFVLFMPIDCTARSHFKSQLDLAIIALALLFPHPLCHSTRRHLYYGGVVYVAKKELTTYKYETMWGYGERWSVNINSEFMGIHIV